MRVDDERSKFGVKPDEGGLRYGAVFVDTSCVSNEPVSLEDEVIDVGKG